MKDLPDIPALMADLGAKATVAAATLATAPGVQRAAALDAAAATVEARQEAILAANAADLAAGRAKDLPGAFLDRLALDPARLAAIASGLRAVAGQPDPVGAVLASWTQPSGLSIRRVATPLGVVGVIFESRPNVTADAGALCVKSGNAVILRAGSESFASATVLAECLQAGLESAGLPREAVQLVSTRDRAAVREMLTMTGTIDVIVPRGGRGLVQLVQSEARVPVFAHLDGVCHVYLHAAADPEVAARVLLNAKTRRPGICGAAECVLVDAAFLARHGAGPVAGLVAAGVEVRADAALHAAVPGTVPAAEADWGREFLDMTIAARVVDGLDAAIAHIRSHGSGHTEAIVTTDDTAASAFFARLDSAILMRNASTQFADGAEFGMGAEIGIATGKLHARGPVGAAQLTSFKYLVEGTAEGSVRP